MKKENKKAKQERHAKVIKIGKKEIKVSDLIASLIIVIIIIAYFLSPKYYSVTTGLYNQGTKDDQKNVITALGDENTEERFEIYFQWYNVVHELGHGLLMYNDGAKLDIVDEEQLVNDFAVAYWKYYGEEEKINELEDIAKYAVENIGDNYKNGVDYLELGRNNSTSKRFKFSFFNFNDYGWFQFSSVKHSFETNKSLESVLKEMGFKNFKLTNQKELVYGEINKEISTQVIKDAVKNFREWGLEYPDVIHHYNKNPNNNYSKPVVKVFGLIEYPDFAAYY